MKKLVLIALGFLSTSIMAMPYQIITDKEDIIHEIEELSLSSKTVGRIHFVDIPKINLTKLSKAATGSIRPIKENLESLSYKYNSFFSGKKSADTSFLINQISKENLYSIVEHLSGYKSRYIGSQGNKDSVEWILDKFKSYGYEVNKECFDYGWYKKIEACNAIGIKKSSSPSDKTIVVMAHLDSVGKEYAGAEDNGSGVAAIIEFARIMKDIPTKVNIEFVAANAEEVGLVGSGHYVKNILQDGRENEILLGLTLDVIGYNTNNLFVIETSKDNKTIADRLAEYGKSYTSREISVNLSPWGSDHISFIENGIPGILTSQSWENHNPCYHKVCDKIDIMDFDYLRDIARVNLAYLFEESKI